jgi:hypothetical protein
MSEPELYDEPEPVIDKPDVEVVLIWTFWPEPDYIAVGSEVCVPEPDYIAVGSEVCVPEPDYIAVGSEVWVSEDESLLFVGVLEADDYDED